MNLTAVWVRNMGIVQSSCAKVRAVSHALPMVDWTRSMARQAANTEVLQICTISSIEALLIAAQVRWTGHVIEVNNRLPKIIFYSELQDGARSLAARERGTKTRSRATLNDAVLCQRTSKHWQWSGLSGDCYTRLPSDNLSQTAFELWKPKENSRRQQLSRAPHATHAKSVDKHVRRELDCAPTFERINTDYDPGSDDGPVQPATASQPPWPLGCCSQVANSRKIIIHDSALLLCFHLEGKTKLV